MTLEEYMLRKIFEVCQRHERTSKPIDKAVLSMVLAEITEVVNDIRAKIKGAIDILPPMPDISVKYKDGHIRVTVDTAPWNDIHPEDERSEWDIDEEDE